MEEVEGDVGGAEELAGVGDGEADVADWKGGEVGIAEGDVFCLWKVRDECTVEIRVYVLPRCRGLCVGSRVCLDGDGLGRLFRRLSASHRRRRCQPEVMSENVLLVLA